MDNNFNEAILNGLVNQNKYQVNTLITPRLLTNRDDSIWSYLRYELRHCQHFKWIVAFITPDMLTPLKVILADLAQQGISGELITGTYLHFNQPAVFQELLKIPNLKVRIASTSGFHIKGYFFDHDNYQTGIIGSANFTRAALLTNKELMLRITSLTDSGLTQQINEEFAQLWHIAQPLTTTWLTNYQQHYHPSFHNDVAEHGSSHAVITPNRMQQAALASLSQLWQNHAHRALIVSATGTGKTYLGALAVQKFQPRRFLFVVHREQILEKALASFRHVLCGRRDDYGILSGHYHQSQARYVFATIQTLARPQVLQTLAPDMFDFILIDEAHRAAAPSYQRIMHYFQPRFWLGMTATPERMDNQDVYQLFDHNLAYEIRLKDALTAHMLCPFHYVGLQDYEYHGQIIDDKTPLRHLTAEARVDYVLTQLAYYGYSGQQVHGLIFCSRQTEAQQLARMFSAKGHPAQALTNQDDAKIRTQAIHALENGELEYLITVDIFNEGIDIPCLNQIVMLRNTQSSIVFIQQLGRGLRKYPHKDFVTIIDFIGNYKNNYLIPLALNDDTSCNKNTARSEVRVPATIGLATINFTKVTQRRILVALDKVKLNNIHYLRQAYLDLKHQLGRIPFLNDFIKYHSLTPLALVKQGKITNYAQFLNKMGETINLSGYASQVLTFLSQELLNGKRSHELLLLRQLLLQDNVTDTQLQTLYHRHHAYVSDALLTSLAKVLSLQFFDVKAGKTTRRNLYGGKALVIHDLLGWHLNDELRMLLQNDVTFKKLYGDVITAGLQLNHEYDNMQQFTLYQAYTRKDVCRLLNWPKDVSAPMYGYRVTDEVCPIFVTYHKDDHQKNAYYHNHFNNGDVFRWYTRAPRHLNSDEVQRLLKGVATGQQQVRIEVFMKNSDADGSVFTYLGRGQIIADTVREEILVAQHKNKVVVGMDIKLQQPLSLRQYQLLFDE